ncbi:ribonucleoside-diphosphate reductase alpha subunit [Singapore grouper iridovirus]|uniref:Uncharacterized protein n=1 Tax=Singapore grouper iridovirus TaxID=262968 RepID=Q5YFK0_9VIRU|nr:hypothetical protein ORF065R [Singapore grouper iridovirus]AAS18080.1 unknown [Singapore grouper iridovirus]WAU86774.1 hypothetical protein ORF065R [Singapore grouper iridovirus]WRW24632.1 ribonucleoside-diphosphate reductase alpha subunit [Singapore grouper iridovirus]
MKPHVSSYCLILKDLANKFDCHESLPELERIQLYAEMMKHKHLKPFAVQEACNFMGHSLSLTIMEKLLQFKLKLFSTKIS